MFDIEAEIEAGKALNATVDDLASLSEDGGWDRLFDDQLATLLVQVHVQRERLAAVELAATAELDRRAIAVNEGHRSTAAWLAENCRLSWGEARRQVGLAAALAAMPVTAAALADGAVDVGRMRRLAAAHSDHPAEFVRDERLLVTAATTLGSRDVARTIDYWRQAADAERFCANEHAAYARRRLYVSRTAFGMGRLDADLDPESLHVIATAIDAIADPAGRDGDERTSAQRRCDALVDICRHALDHGDLPVSGGQRPHISALIDVEVLQRHGLGTSELGDGRVISGEAARRLACDAAITRVITDGPSSICDVGRTTRTVPAATRTALDVRDRGCTWQGCDRPSHWCDAHHIEHWADGGPTDLDNLQLLCRHHHRLTHEAEP